jgi:DNA-binding response OmpR family regulator
MTSQAAGPPVHGSTLKPRILVVEDEVLIALLISDALVDAGFDVIGPCQTVDQALAQLRVADCCDAAVLDASLRNESASPVAATLKKLEIPFLLATGYSPGQLPEDLAAVPTLTKPLNTEELIGHLHGFLSVRHCSG